MANACSHGSRSLARGGDVFYGGPLRLATLIIALVLTLIVWFQSCAAMVGGGLGEEFGTAAEKREARDLSDASGAGLVAGILWVVGAGLVMTRPNIARWVFLAAAPILLIAGSGGYEDAYIWAGVSIVFMAMAWRGIGERKRKQEAAQQAQYAQFQQWQQWQQHQNRQVPSGPSSSPPGGEAPPPR